MITTKKFVLIGLLILISVGTGVGWYVLSNRTQDSGVNKALPEILIRPREYDLEEVDLEGGEVIKVFRVFNNGEGQLKIKSIRTSCGCTTAQLIYDSKKSPTFGMHSSSLFWSETIPPGEKAQLKVTLDPATHGRAGLGPFVRSIWVSSNDPYNEKLEVRIKGSVVG